MEFLSRFSMRTRLFMGFAFTLLAVGMGVLAGIQGLREVGRIADEAAGPDSIKLITAQEWRDLVRTNVVRTRALLTTDDPALAAELTAELKGDSDRATELQDRMKALATTEHGQQLLERIGVERAEYRAIRERAVNDRAAGKPVGDRLRKEVLPASARYLTAFDELVTWQKGVTESARARVGESVTRSLAWMLACTLVGVLVSVIAAFAIARSIVNPLNRVREGALRIAAGDLSTDLQAHGNDEAAEMTRAIASMQSSLRKLVGDVRSGVQEVTTASAEIANGSVDLSRRTEQQAGSLEETAASMEEFSSTVQGNAAAAREASTLVASATETAERGGAVAGRVVATMAEISESSRKIADIIGVIDGIAFQTNILALNAAVEAARAGEQGRGFAVVASEVRTLAQRSAQAAREIKTLIEDSVGKVELGGRLVDESGRTMAEIVRGVNSVASIMDRILGSTMEQSAGIQQVSVAINQLDDMTQQNAALVEQSTAAAESLRSQAVALGRAIDAFHGNADGAAGIRAATVAHVAHVTPAVHAAPRAPAARIEPVMSASKPAAKPHAAPAARKPAPKVESKPRATSEPVVARKPEKPPEPEV